VCSASSGVVSGAETGGAVKSSALDGESTISIASYPDAHYAHQGWLSDDHRYFFLDDEEDGGPGVKTRTVVFDLKDLSDPVMVAQFAGATDATDHNLYIRGQYMFQANYAAGLRIVDIADPKNAKEVGYFDTYPSNDTPGFVGAFTNFPYFRDGIVAINNMSDGLFILRFRPPTKP